MKALLLAVLVSGDVQPNAPAPQLTEPDPVVRVLKCDRIPVFGMTCAIPALDLNNLVEANNWKADRITELEAEVKKLKELKGCAKVEITKPSKQVPGFKKEKDL